MRGAAIIAVGKLRLPCWREAAERYLKLIRRWRQIEIKEVKDSPGNLPLPERCEKEGADLLAVLTPADLAICMDEHGHTFTSREFAEFLRHCDETHMRRPAFIIGGAWGLSAAVLNACPVKISLSGMTWPHELARVLLLEQIYRAESILRGAPYHH